MRKILFPIIILTMASCVKDDSNQCPTDQTEIKAQSSIINVATRSPNDNLPTGARVLVTTTSGNYDSPYKNGTMAFAAQGGDLTGFDGGPVYYPNAQPIYLSAFNPAFAWRFRGGIAYIDYAGFEDILCAQEVSSTILQAEQGVYPTMAFKHILTQLIINVQATSSASNIWGNITDIKLTSAMGENVKDSIQVDIVTGICTQLIASNNTLLDFFQVTDNGTVYTNNAVTSVSIPIPTTYQTIAYTLCAPVIANNTSTEYTIHVNTLNFPDGVSIPVNLKQLIPITDDYEGTTQAYSFTINLNFVAQEILAAATIQPWENKGTATQDVH